MKEVRNEAFKLRLQGYSYNEINKALGVPKSTLSGWFSGLVLSKNAQKRLEKRKSIGSATLVKRNKLQTHKAWERVRLIKKEAKNEIEQSKGVHRDLLLIGAALYWGEGYKKLRVQNGRELPGHVLSLTNSDPDMARMFVQFLHHAMNVPLSDIRLSLRLYRHINEKNALKYWLNATGLPKECHKGTTYLVSIASKGKRPYNRLPHGTVEIRINDTRRFHRIMGWIEWMKNMQISSSGSSVG